MPRAGADDFGTSAPPHSSNIERMGGRYTCAERFTISDAFMIFSVANTTFVFSFFSVLCVSDRVRNARGPRERAAAWPLTQQ